MDASIVAYQAAKGKGGSVGLKRKRKNRKLGVDIAPHLRYYMQVASLRRLSQKSIRF
jgi:hypothetical protein